MQISIQLAGFGLPILLVWTAIWTAWGTRCAIKKIPSGKWFNLGYQLRFTSIDIGVPATLTALLLTIWIAFEPISFAQYAYSLVQILAAYIVSEILALGLTWILKGHKYSLMNLRKA